MTNDEIEFTKAWWHRCLSNPDKLNAWLQKLQNTEIGGYHDYNDFSVRHIGKLDARVHLSLNHIAEDEKKHSDILIALMTERGIALKPAEECPSWFWTYMNQFITDVESFCAVNYFGENLAAERFEIILSVPETPSDIKDALRIILPDEQFHRTALKKFAGEEAIERIRAANDFAIKQLRDGPSRSTVASVGNPV